MKNGFLHLFTLRALREADRRLLDRSRRQGRFRQDCKSSHNRSGVRMILASRTSNCSLTSIFILLFTSGSTVVPSMYS
uniref:Uncharacterized protein n=1 Tax=viral metagenome TaxID=1070528 RepID=A0A6C0IYH5_9ZZZZ